MLSISDAVTNDSMRKVVAYARAAPRSGTLSPQNRQLLDQGVSIVGGQIALTAHASASRAWLNQRSADLRDDSLHEYEENEFFMWTATPFSDPTWRVEILAQGMLIVQELAPLLISVVPLPVQIILNINSAFDEDPEEGSDATVGVVKFFMLRSDGIMDQRPSVERLTDPVAIFTLPALAG